MASKAKEPTAAELAGQIQELEAERASNAQRRATIEAQLARAWSDKKARETLTGELARLTNDDAAMSGALEQLRAAHGAAEQRAIEAQRQALEAELKERIAARDKLIAERDRRLAALKEAEREVNRSDALVRDASDRLRFLDRRRG